MDKMMAGQDGEMGIETLSDAAVHAVYDRTKHLMNTLVDFKELMMMYTCAMKEVQTKFDILNTEYKIRCQHHPISAIQTRLKRMTSIADKLSRGGHKFSMENIERYIHDIAGVRVVCPYIDDIYALAEAFLKQDDITLVASKDYIASPKVNGYRSLHLIVTVPVFFAEQKKDMAVEVQIRTIAMDFWASLEHQMKYKQDIPHQSAIVAELRDCAEEIAAIDQRMMEIRQRIDAAADTPTEEDELLEKLSKLDVLIN